MSFVHLHVHTQYSLLDGANKIGPLIDHAKASGMEAIAMTDHGNMFGAVEFYQKAKAAGVKPIIGCEVYLAPGKRTDRTQVPRSDDFDGGGNFHLIVLAQNREGYGNLSELITLARTRAPKGEYRLTPQDLSRPDCDNAHLRGMPDCLAILVPAFPAKEEALEVQIEWLDVTFPGRAWVGLVLHQRAMDDIHRGAVEYVADRQNVPVVALGNVVMHVRSRKPLQDTMTAIRIGKPVHECGYDLAPNAEQHLRSRLRIASTRCDRS